jgi:phosphoribosylglycinamide formyltransferase-1
MEAIVRSAQSGILRDCCTAALVFSNRADAKGLDVAQALGVETACIESKGKKRSSFDGEVLTLLESYRLDYIVLAGYRWAFENRLTTTKITVHFVDEGVDTGPVIGQREVDLRGSTSLKEVEARGLAVEHEFYSEQLAKLFRQQAGDSIQT